MAKTIGELNVEIGAKLTKLDEGLRKMGDSLTKAADRISQKYQKSFDRVGKYIVAAFSVQAISGFSDRLIQFGDEAVQLAAKVEGVRAAFNKLNDERLLSDLRRATRGTVSDIELMRQAVRAQNFQVPLNKLATFFEFATKRSAQTGESVDYLVQSIIDGIGRKSTLVLDNLGISAARLQEEVKQVGDFGQAAGNIIQQELGKAGDVALTSAQKIAQQKAELENLKTEIGSGLIPVQLKLNKAVNETIRGFANIGNFLGNFTFVPLKLSAENFDLLEKAIGRTLTGLERAEIRANGFNSEQRKLITSLKEGTFWASASGEALLNKWRALGDTAGVTKETTNNLDNLNNSIEEEADLLGEANRKFIEQQRLLIDNAKFWKNYSDSIEVPDLEEIGLEDEEGVIDAITEKFDNMAKNMALAAEAGNLFGGVLQSSFEASLISGENFFEVFGKGLENMIKQLSAAVLSATILSAVISSFTGLSFGSSFGAIFGGSNSGGSGLGGGFGSFFQLLGTDLVASTDRTGTQQGRFN